MNKLSSLVVKWYVGISVLALIGGSSLGPVDYFYGIAFALLVLFFYIIGVLSVSKRAISRNARPIEKSVSLAFLYSLSMLSILGSYYLTSFYTGNDFYGVLTNFLLSQSNYNSYQQYSAENNLTSFTSDQIPAFVFSIFSKVWVVYVYSTILAGSKRIGRHELIVLFLSSLSLLYQAFGRGTSIEIFELVILIWCSLLVRKGLYSNGNRVKRKFILPIIFLMGLGIFNFNLSARQGFDDYISCITHEICFDSDSTILGLSSIAAEITYRMEGYFTFGLFFLSRFIEESISTAGSLNLFNYILPVNKLLHSPIRDSVCYGIIDCGYAWTPDAILFLELLGAPLFFVLVFYVGRVTSEIEKMSCFGLGFLKFGVIYYLIMTMLSIPVGNFIFSSYPNMASALIIFGFLTLNRMRVIVVTDKTHRVQ